MFNRAGPFVLRKTYADIHMYRWRWPDMVDPNDWSLVPTIRVCPHPTDIKGMLHDFGRGRECRSEEEERFCEKPPGRLHGRDDGTI